MMHYYKDTPEGRIWYSGSIKLINEDRWVSNPPKELLESEGWISFEPEEPSLYIGNDSLFEDIWRIRTKLTPSIRT